MKVQIIKCKTCGTVFAACKDGYQTAGWYKDCARHMATENAVIETIESDGNVFNGDLNTCCGKKAKK